MNELVYSGIGSQKSDQAIEAIASQRPLWLLKPLPLQQVNDHAYGRYDEERGKWLGSGSGRAETLQSVCLGVISQNLHTYHPTTLSGLAPHLAQRVMNRALSDRRFTPGEVSLKRPDDATLWAFIVLGDPSGAAEHLPSHTLALPTANTLANLAPSRNRTGVEAVHPLVAAPELFRQVPDAHKFAFLTTLQLDGMDDGVTDSSITSLRYATNLTCLWTRSCRSLTDDGIRMLASSLSPPDDTEEATGLWRLRAWYLKGCARVSDKSMRSFARLPGLVLLDVRDTSCTDVVGGIFNRANASLWSDAQPPFQPCTDGLRDLFANDHPDTILANLAQTLIKDDIPEGGNTLLALHLRSSLFPPEDHDLPEPKSKKPQRPNFRENPFGGAFGGGVYKHGMGQMYGSGARNITDDTNATRHRVKLALELQAEDNIINGYIARGEKPPERRFDRERREMKELDKQMKRQTKRKYDDRGYAPRRNATGREWLISKVFKDPAAKQKQQKRLPTGIRILDDNDTGRVAGDSKLMLVRLVAPNWETLRPVVARSAPSEFRAKRRAEAANGLATLLSQDVQTPAVQMQASQTQASQDVKPDVKPDLQTRVQTQSSQASVGSSSHFNPFRAVRGARPRSGVTRLGEHIRPEVDAERALLKTSTTSPEPGVNSSTSPEPRVNQALRAKCSGITPLKSSGITPLKSSGITPPKSSGVTSLKSSGITPLNSSTARSGVTPLFGAPRSSGTTAGSRKPSTPLPPTASKPQPKGKSPKRPAEPKQTQTLLGFFKRKAEDEGGARKK